MSITIRMVMNTNAILIKQYFADNESKRNWKQFFLFKIQIFNKFFSIIPKKLQFHLR